MGYRSVLNGKSVHRLEFPRFHGFVKRVTPNEGTISKVILLDPMTNAQRFHRVLLGP